MGSSLEGLSELEALFEHRGVARVLAYIAASETGSDQGVRFTELARGIAAGGGYVPDTAITRSLQRLRQLQLIEVVDEPESSRRPSYRLTSLGREKSETLDLLLEALHDRNEPRSVTHPGARVPHIDRSDHTTAGLDTTVWHSARLYDYWLGGKDNFEVDREMADRIAQVIPAIREMARTNREFMHRVARYLVGDAGIRQFLDIGTGIPTTPNLHEVAQKIAPETRVIYVDNDPLVLVHARALMVSGDRGRTEYLHADLLRPGKILLDAGRVDVLDFNQPVALTVHAVLMLLRDDQDPWGKVQVIKDALPSGSYLTITHPTGDFDREAMAAAVAANARTGGTFVPRCKAEVDHFFDGWEFIEPGLVPILAWRPEAEPADPNAAYYWAGVARKP
jgi:DNA-binding HxlR family transcriptional regulator